MHELGVRAKVSNSTSTVKNFHLLKIILPLYGFCLGAAMKDKNRCRRNKTKKKYEKPKR